MHGSLKKIKYLQCDTRYRVKRESLERVVEMAVKSGLLPCQGPKEILEKEALNALLQENSDIINIAHPILQSVFDDFNDKTRLILMCDSKGYIIHMVSSLETLQWCFSRGVVLGACMDYYSLGTNSVSMAIFQGCPTAIVGDEHYCDVMKDWDCIAAPIRVRDVIKGYIDISDQANSDLFQLISLVNLTAELIKERLEEYQSDKKPNSKGTPGDDFNPNGYDSNPALDRAMFFGSLMANGQGQWNLTMKEIQVLFELYTGKNQRDISKNFNISINTVKTHTRNIHQKLGAESHNELIKKIKSIVLEK